MKSFNPIILILLLTSCKVMYQPPIQQVPMFTEKGELQVSAGNRNASVAYSITPGLGVTASGYYRQGNLFSLTDGKTSGYHGEQRSFSLGVGHYKVTKVGSVEIFGSYGRGYSAISYGYSSGGIGSVEGGRSHFNTFAVQPNVILGKGRVKSGISNRLSVLNFYDFSDANNTPLTPKTLTFFEPAFTLRVDVHIISFKTQFQFSFPLADAKDTYGFYSPYNDMFLINAALELRVSQLSKRKE